MKLCVPDNSVFISLSFWYKLPYCLWIILSTLVIKYIELKLLSTSQLLFHFDPKIFNQIISILMGSDPAPFFCQLILILPRK